MRRKRLLSSCIALVTVPLLTFSQELEPVHPVVLFSQPDYSQARFREASDQAAVWLANHDEELSRNVVVKTDVTAIRELIRQVESDSESFERLFDISPYSEVPCVTSSIQASAPRVTQPNGFSISLRCEPSSTLANITVLKDENHFHINLISVAWGAFVVRSLGDWDYSLAYRNDAFRDPRKVQPEIH